MLKQAVAGTLLLIGCAVSASIATAAPRNDDCVNCEPARQPYDSENPARIRQEMDRPRVSEENTPAPSEPSTYPKRGETPSRECSDCPPPKHYDSIEVIKNSHDVDRSRVINTESVVPVKPRVRELNKLIIHENETRNVGTIQHNHRIIEKEIRYVRRAPVYRHPSYQVQTVIVPVIQQPCGCPCSCGGGLFGALAQRSYGGGYGYAYPQPYAYPQGQVAVQQVLVPAQVPAGYGYGYGYR